MGLTAMVAAFVVALLMVAVIVRANDLERFENLSRQNCQAVEALKKRQRDRAIEAFRNLDRDLRLLGIKKTPELVRTAREGRDTTLRRFAEGEC
jgi:hypothetical protein